MLRIASILAFAFVSTAALADGAAPAPTGTCYTEQALANDAKSAGQTEAGAVTFRSDHADEMIVVQGPSSLMAYFFKAGCLVNLVAVDTVTPDHGA